MFSRFSNRVAQAISSIGGQRLVACLTFAIASSVATGAVLAQDTLITSDDDEYKPERPTKTRRET